MTTVFEEIIKVLEKAKKEETGIVDGHYDDGYLAGLDKAIKILEKRKNREPYSDDQ